MSLILRSLLLSCCTFLLVVAGCEMPDREETHALEETMQAPDNQRTARATLSDDQEMGVTGQVVFSEREAGVHIEAYLEGVRPNTTYALYLHEGGDCSAPETQSMGAPFEAAAEINGAATPATDAAPGRIGVLRVTGENVGSFNQVDGALAMDGAQSIVDRAVVLYAAPSGARAEPGPGAGEPLACGIIEEDDPPGSHLPDDPTTEEERN